MKIPFSFRVALVFVAGFLTLGQRGASAAAPYIGEWSSGRGEVLIITPETVQYEFRNGSHKPVPYRDITKAMDGKGPFQLMILVKANTYYFQKFTLGLH